jgi:hypothetical protein
MSQDFRSSMNAVARPVARRLPYSLRCPGFHRLRRRVASSPSTLGIRINKLDLRDRAQAVVVAYETGLVQPGSS